MNLRMLRQSDLPLVTNEICETQNNIELNDFDRHSVFLYK